MAIIPTPQPPFQSTTNELIYLLLNGQGDINTAKVWRYFQDSALNEDANNDYSSAAETFFFNTPASTGISYSISKVGIVGVIIETPPTVADPYVNYGASSGVLTNGISIEYVSPSTPATAIHPGRIYTVVGGAMNGFTYELIQSTGDPARAFFKLEIDFEALTGSPFLMEPDSYFQVILNDDFTPLAAHKFYASGTEL